MPTSEFDNEIGLLSATKIKSFPVVNSTCYWLTESYLKLKQANFVTKCTCGLAETTLKNSMYLATPLVNRFRDQVTSLDSLAFNQLEKLETAFPIIKSNADTIVSQSKELLMNKTVKPVRSSYKTLKTNTIGCLSSPALVNRFLDLTQNFLETYLIEEDLKKLNHAESVEDYIKYYGEYKINEEKYNDLVKRIQMLTYVFYYALKTNSLNQAQMALKVLTVKLSKLYMYLELMNAYKTSATRGIKEKFYLTKEKFELYKEYLDVLSKTFTVQDGRSLHHVNSLEDRTKIIIRRSLGNLIAAFHLVYSRVLNVIPLVHTRFTLLGQFIADLYQIYTKHDGSFNAMLVETIMREVRDCTYKTQSSIDLFVKNLNNSAIVAWFVPNFESFGVLDYDNEDFAIEKPEYSTAKNAPMESSEEELNGYTYSSEEFSHPNSGHHENDIEM